MNQDDQRRAIYIGEMIAANHNPNMAAGLPVANSMEANAQAHADLSRGQQGVPATTPLWSRVLDLFKW